MNIARTIDHTILKPETNEMQIRALCDEAVQYQFASVCVNPCWVPVVSSILQGHLTKTCSVVGFPLGATSSEAKATESAQAISRGAEEIDMVINIGWLKSGHLSRVAEDIAIVRNAVPVPYILKVIIETSALTDEEIKTVAGICIEQRADFVKTSTGFHPTGGAKLEHVRLIKEVVGIKAQIKASGGIRTYDDVIKFLDAGASRIGCSSGVQIMQEASCRPAR